jgi:DNA processing protein
MTACHACLRRTDLIAALAGRIEIAWRRRAGPGRVLALPDGDLLALGDSGVHARYAAFDGASAQARVDDAGLVAVCRCSERYPAALEDLPDPPAVLHVAGSVAAVADADRVGIVGARAASSYGREVAWALGRATARAGVGVVSGLALGIDAAAHDGALAEPRSAIARPIAVLAGGADRPYPARGHRLHAAVRAAGAVVSELPPGFGVHRWAFVARNRIIAALSTVLVVVEASERSGSLTTADFAANLGRTVAAVPGRVTARNAAGSNGLIRDGAPLIRDASDVLDLLADVTGTVRSIATEQASQSARLEPALDAVLARIEAGERTLAELARTPAEAREVLAALGELEARGLVRRAFAGDYERAS